MALSRPAVAARLSAAGCVFADDEADVLVAAARSATELAALVARRAAGTPLEQVVGWAAFAGLRIAVEPGVFVPRRRTELLVRQAATLLAPGAVVVDLCCGTGAIGAALRATCGAIELHAVDCDPVAVRCARRNLAGAGAAVSDGEVHAGDLYEPLPGRLRGRVDVLVCNAPYVPTDAIATLPPEARDHEPRTALDGGADGLDLHRRVAVGAPAWLAPGGALLLETSVEQAARTAALVAGGGLIPRVVRDDGLDATVVVGVR